MSGKRSRDNDLAPQKKKAASKKEDGPSHKRRVPVTAPAQNFQDSEEDEEFDEFETGSGEEETNDVEMADDTANGEDTSKPKCACSARTSPVCKD
jgi:hypothetical protein